ncbi:CRISPR-associated protein [Alkalihalophilus pseudofirmus]|nr:CRISPR-associated protein [Alkalihalophilus pseudofirmus]
MNEKVKIYTEKLKTDRSAANQYYREHLFEEVSQSFIKKVHDKQEKNEFKQYDYLIMSVGFSIGPLVMWIRALRPKEVFFICSEETEDLVNEICMLSNLKFTQCDHTIVRRTNGKDVYEKINEYIDKHRIKQQGLLNLVAIDITGGKKNMVSGCSLAANHLGIDLLYIDNNGYLPGVRKQLPGNEEPILLEDPLEVFGDRDLFKGITKFNSEDFEQATEIFRGIKERVVQTRNYETYEQLSIGYSHLEGMRFHKAHYHISQAIEWAEKLEMTNIPLPLLKQQLIAIEPLIKLHEIPERQVLSDNRLFWHLFGYLFKMADHYMNGKKYDISALLTYRCLEFIVQSLLLKQFDIHHSNPRYTHLDTKKILEKFNEISNDVYHDYRPLHRLPNKVTLMTGLIMLRALDEPMIRNVNIRSMNEYITARNKSRLVHGFDLLDKSQVEPFIGRVRGLASYIWNHEKHELSFTEGFDRFASRYAFVNIELNRKPQQVPHH